MGCRIRYFEKSEGFRGLGAQYTRPELMFMWEFGWGSFAGRGAARAARHRFPELSSLSYRLDETERKGSRHPRSA